MATMEVGTQHKPHRFIANEVLDFGLTSKDLTGSIPVAAIKDFAFIDPDWFLLTTSFNVFDKNIEGLALNCWEDIGEGVGFKKLGHNGPPHAQRSRSRHRERQIPA